MHWLGLVFGVFAVAVPMGALSIGRSVVTYRITGRERPRALRGALVLLIASALWSVSALTLWLSWAGPNDSLLDLDGAFQLFPIVFGWLPASLYVVLAWPRMPGTGERLPGWVRWMDLLWMG